MLLFMCLLLAAAACTDTAMLMQVKQAKTTDHEMTTDASGNQILVTYAEHRDANTGAMVYYKKMTDQAKSVNKNNAPTVYFRQSKSSAWQLLPQDCPIPKIMPKQGIDKCEKGWRIGKSIATMAAYMGLSKSDDIVESLTHQNQSNSAAHDRLKRQRTKQTAVETTQNILESLQNCVKKGLKDSGFTVQKVCLHKGLVSEGKSLVSSFKQHAVDPNSKCDYLTLKKYGHCINTNPPQPQQPHITHPTTSTTTRKKGALGA